MMVKKQTDTHTPTHTKRGEKRRGEEEKESF